MEAANKLFFVLISLVVVTISRAYAASVSWNLFVPQHFNLPELPVLMSLALTALITMMTPSSAYVGKGKEHTTGDIVYYFSMAIITPWLGYLIILAATSIYF